MFEQAVLEMFNKKASSDENKPDKIIQSLNIQSSEIIADIGSGGGYFTMRFAEEVGARGIVYAVDTNTKNLVFIKEKAREAGVADRVTIVLADEAESNLFSDEIDLVFMRNSFHHLKNPAAYCAALRRVLKKDGRVAIIDYNKRTGFIGIFGHYTPEEELVRTMNDAGFIKEQSFDFLPTQSFIIFRRSEKKDEKH